ncbi:hypothetical protein D3C72_1235580 [compost metagenome]
MHFHLDVGMSFTKINIWWSYIETDIHVIHRGRCPKLRKRDWLPILSVNVRNGITRLIDCSSSIALLYPVRNPLKIDVLEPGIDPAVHIQEVPSGKSRTGCRRIYSQLRHILMNLQLRRLGIHIHFSFRLLNRILTRIRIEI